MEQINKMLTLGKMKCKDMMFRKALLPILEKPFDDQCRSNSHNMHCFKSGDSRTNEQPGKIHFKTIHNLKDYL